MAVRIRIATKIFALAAILLLLTVALSAFSLWQTHQLQGELSRIHERYLPLDNELSDLDVHGYQRRLAFERWRALLEKPAADPRIAAQIQKEYAQHNTELAGDVSAARRMIETAAADGTDAHQLGRMRGLLDEVQRDTDLVAGIQVRVLEHHSASDRAMADELMRLHDTLQADLEQRRKDLNDSINELTERASEAARLRFQRLVGTSIAATTGAVLLGVVIAWLITRRMVHPVETLMSGVLSVEKGDLTVQIPVRSTDEIGVLTGQFNRLVDELRSKERMKETFGKYIDPKIVEKVILNPGAAETEGGKRVMTISFCDLVGFTGIGESLTPAGLVRLLNRHFELIAGAIHAHHGVLDKFIGDAVMAFWGPPFSQSGDHAALACRAALAQVRMLDQLRAELPELTGLRRNVPAMDLRVGLASGDVVVGNIGADNARTYTVIGDTVNLASRLESVNRVYNTRILISGETRRLAAEAIEVREIDWIAVKGKSEPATVFELLGLAGEVEKPRLTTRERYEEGLHAYRMFDWGAAETALRGVLEISTTDGPAALLLSRIAKLRAEPPADWDGVWHLTEK
jgi:adenylate cyclase